MAYRIVYYLFIFFLSFTPIYSAPYAEPKGKYVGELQERWKFPSDHLPIGLTLDNLHFASWNVLNTKHIHWVIEKNSQGLSHSMIADEHVFIENSSLTLRDKHVVELILQMIAHPTHPKCILALQESGESFLEELRNKLPSYFEIVANGELAFLFDNRLFEIHSQEEIFKVFEHEPQKSIQDIILRRFSNGQLFRFINVHLPGDPTKPAPLELALYLASSFNSSLTTIAMGDMNFTAIEMGTALDNAFIDLSPFSLYSPYCTNISPEVFTSKAIDHFLFYSNENLFPSLNEPNEILIPLAPTVDLLNPYDYIHPLLANFIDAPLPYTSDSDLLVGIYGNIFYPQDQEQKIQIKLTNWIQDFDGNRELPFPLTSEEINGLSLYILERFPLKSLTFYFATLAQNNLEEGFTLEDALEYSKQDTLAQGKLYLDIAKTIPQSNDRLKMLRNQLLAASEQIERSLTTYISAIKQEPETLISLLKISTIESISDPFTWETRIHVLKQMIDKIILASPKAPYFLALQEVTPLALEELKNALAEKNLQWISFNNISGKETLPSTQEEIFGESTAFTSTLALSHDLKVLKIELGNLPTESGSIRKIIGVRVQNSCTNEIYNLFSTHTDHKIQNEIYLRTALKIHDFVTQFLEDAPDNQKFIIGGDLNAFEEQGGDKFLQKLRDFFPDSQDFRETDYYAPYPINSSSFIGRFDNVFSASLAKNGKVKPSALDHILVGNGIKLHSSHREAGVYSFAGELLDYFSDKQHYMFQLQDRVTFSDHFFNIVRCK